MLNYIEGFLIGQTIFCVSVLCYKTTTLWQGKFYA